ncbi:MAG: FtsW/RodA/SpoVE family cell cycle protein [Lachnospiraceae bacterium]|nr:FtsW/RodA/SpoVE family cell cycle protein [Lachnospiraceae bacterium]
MINIIVELSKYLLLAFMLLFTIFTYTAMRAKTASARSDSTRAQLVFMLLFNFLAYAVIFLQKPEPAILIIYAGITLYMLLVNLVYHLAYKKASVILINTMCMLISIGLVIITRLDVDDAYKQLVIAIGATVISFFIPIIIRKAKIFSKWGLFFAILGILLLAAVFVLGRVYGGSRLYLEFHGITFQLSEFVKLTFVFFIAGMLYHSTSFKQVFFVTVLAAIHVVILVASTDLGAGLVYFVAYMVMVCVATRKIRYAVLGLGGMAGASVVAYRLFSHVRVRVSVWRDPVADYQDTGYQIVQALLSICAGGWFGTGLLRGSPDMVPLVERDFTFAAICEELGILFAICLILLCMVAFLIIMNIAVKLDNDFYKLIALGFGTEYAFQVFLTIGGTVKLIPMTGITLPLVSYGGSSITCTIFMFAIIQGLYIMRTDVDDSYYDDTTFYEPEPETGPAEGTSASAYEFTHDQLEEQIAKENAYRTQENGSAAARTNQYIPGEETEEFERRIIKEAENSINS